MQDDNMSALSLQRAQRKAPSSSCSFGICLQIQFTQHCQASSSLNKVAGFSNTNPFCVHFKYFE